MYTILFNENGERHTSIVEGVHFGTEEEKAAAIEKCRQDAVKSGYTGELLVIEVSDEDQELYATNEYIHDTKTGKPIPKPPYVATVQEVADQTWLTVKTARNTAEQSGCPYMDKVLDSDSTSVQRINTAVQAAQFAQAQNQKFIVNWTMQDNSTITMSISEVLGMPVALAAYSNQLHEKARQLRESVDKIVVDYDAKILTAAKAKIALGKIKFEI